MKKVPLKREQMGEMGGIGEMGEMGGIGKNKKRLRFNRNRNLLINRG